MNYMLDASVCIDYLRRPGSPMREWMRARDRKSVHICSVVRAELLVGVRKCASVRHRLAVYALLAMAGSYPFDNTTAEAYADIRADLERRGQGIGPNDTQIAAIALTHGATLVTGNPKEFRRVSSLAVLSLEDLAAGKTTP